MGFSWLKDWRRIGPRIAVDSLCSEIAAEYGGRERHAFVVDLSEDGLRVRRPFAGGPTPRDLQLELEVPGLDEILWARGEVCHDQLVRGARPGELTRVSGIRLLSVASRDKRLLREVVIETARARALEHVTEAFEFSSAFALG
jgi:hypothetical protein